MTEVSKTADRALALLERVAEEGPAKAPDLAARMGLSRTVLHRLLVTLQGRGFVRRTEEGFVAGPVLLRAAKQAYPQLLEAIAAAARALADEVGETVVGHVPEGDEAVVVFQALARGHLVRAEHEVGSRHLLTVGASGRAILAFLDMEAQKRLLASASDPGALAQLLEDIRRAGYAVSYDELQRGVHGIAVPVLDAQGLAVGSLAILVPTQRAGSPTDHVDSLLAAGQELSGAVSSEEEPASGNESA